VKGANVTSLTLEQAVAIARATLEKGREAGYKPLTVAVLDDSGVVKVIHRDDGSSLLRPEIAVGKAWGSLGMGLSSRAIADLAAERPQFAASLAALAGGRVVPAAGGVLVQDGSGDTVGAVGVTGDTSDNDEECALAGIEAAGLRAGR
jgi:uncharacterized protein GlcG (DUF336 family)